MILLRYTGVFVLFFATPLFFVEAQDPTYITTLTTQLLGAINKFVPVLTALALTFFIWGLVVFIAQSGNEKVREEGKQKMVWGIIALFIIISVWGLVSLVQEVTGVDGSAVGLNNPQTTYP